MGSGNTKPFPLTATPLSPTTDFTGSYHFPPPPSHPRSRPTPQRHASHHSHSALQSPLQNPRHPSQLLDTFPTPPPKLLRVYSPPSRTPSPTLLPPPLYNSPRAGPQKSQAQQQLGQRRRSNSGGSGASPRSVASESHQSLAEISCVSSLISEPEEIDVIGEEDDEDDVDEEEGGDVLGGLGEQEQHVESLRRFRTQQAIRNLLLEREVKILQAQLEELELMEKEEQVAVGLRGAKDTPTPYDSAFSLAELNRLYNNVLRVSPVPPPLTPPFISPTQPAPQPTLQDRQSPSLLQFKPSASLNGGGGGGLDSQMPVSPAHSASDKSCHTEPGIGRVREAKVRRLKQKQHKRRVLQQQQQQQQNPRGGPRQCSGSSGPSERDTILDRLHKGLPAAPSHRRSTSNGPTNGSEAKASGDEKEGGERGGGKWAFQQSSGLGGSYRLQARRKRPRGSHIVFLDESTGSTGCRFPAPISTGAGAKKATGGEAGGGAALGQQDTARSVGSSASIECDMVTHFLHKAGHLTLLDASSDFTAGVGPSLNEPSGSGKAKPKSPKRTGAVSQESPSSCGSGTSLSRAAVSESGATPRVAHPPLGQDKDKPEQGGRAAKLAKNAAASASASACASASSGAEAAGGGASGAALSCMATRWAEVELLLCKPIACSADITRTMLQTDAGLAFMDQLDQRARELNVLRGTLARWLLPFDTNTAASEQRSVIESVLENEPDDLRGKLPQEEIQYLVRGANNVRRLIRVKIADDADLDQARRALRTAQTFFNALMNDADVACLEPYELLCKNTQSLQQLTEDDRNTAARSHSNTIGADHRGEAGDQKSESTPSQSLKNSGAIHKSMATGWDVTRLLTREGLEEALGRPISSIACDATKPLEQSDITVLTLVWNDEDAKEVKVILKHVDVQSQRARIEKSDEKWRISLRSFANEYLFYSKVDLNQLSSECVKVPHLHYLHHQRLSETDIFAQTWTMIVTYFAPEHFVQHQNLTFERGLVMVTGLARFHAYFWGKTTDAAAGLSDLFPRGGWWRKDLRPSVKFHTLPEAFASCCRNFKEEFECIDTPQAHAAMAKLTSSLAVIGEKVRSKGNRTLIHGDAKTSNLFFSTDDQELALIDFQWTGHASSGGGDVAYALWCGMQLPAVRREDELLRHYHHTLTSHLPPGAPAYPYEEWLEDYEWEFLDYFSTGLPQLMNGITREYCEENKTGYGWLTHEYDPSVASLFCQKAVEICSRRLS